jgi:hypothetical protein
MRENLGKITSYEWIHVDRISLRADVGLKCAESRKGRLRLDAL